MKAYSQLSRRSLCCNIFIFRLLLALPLSCFPAWPAVLVCLCEFILFCFSLLYFEGYSFRWLCFHRLYLSPSHAHYFLTCALLPISLVCVYRHSSNIALTPPNNGLVSCPCEVWAKPSSLQWWWATTRAAPALYQRLWTHCAYKYKCYLIILEMVIGESLYMVLYLFVKSVP